MPTDRTRTPTIIITAPLNEDYRVFVDRETVRTYENGDEIVVADSARRHSFPVGEIAERSLPGGAASLATYADLQVFLSACAEDLGTLGDTLRAAAEAVRAANLAAAAAEQNQPPAPGEGGS